MSLLKSILLLPLFAYFSFSVITGCNEDSTSDLLTASSFDDINFAIYEATKGHNPQDIKTDQYYKYEDNYQVELNEPHINSQFEGEVLNVKETETQYSIRVLETVTTYRSKENPQIDKKEEVYIIEKSAGLNLHNALAQLKSHKKSITAYTLNPASDALKAYDLKVSQNKIAYPKAIQKRWNCDPQKPCEFRGTRIQFKLQRKINAELITMAIDRIYISDGSFLAGVFSSCESRFIPIGDRDYYVKQCSVLRDFKE